MKKLLITSVSILCLSTPALAQSIVEVPDWDSKLTKDWGGARQSLADKGIIVEMNSVHISQYVFDGGIENNANGQSIDDDAHTLSTELDVKFDTHKLGLWPGGMLRVWTEVRNGRSATGRAGAAVNYDALIPSVQSRTDDDVIAVNEVAYTQFFTESFGAFGGLIDSAYGDENDFAGNGRSNDYFLNLNFNANPISMASTPDSGLGGGLIYIPNEKYSGWAGAYSGTSAAGFNPFDNNQGTTFFAEGTRNHTLSGKPGHQVLAGVYGINKDRADLFSNPRLALESIITNQALPVTDDDTWAIYYNLQQYIQGDSEKGWGVFLRAGISDGDPNPLENTLAGGIGGKGIIDSRPNDRFGVGAFWAGYSDDGLPDALDIDDSYGFEAFYSFEVVPGLNITPDIQFIESPDTLVDDTTIVGGIRTKWDF